MLSLVRDASPAALLRDALRERIELAMMKLVDELFQQEVRALCGQRYRHGQDTKAKRAGSEKGSIYWDSQRRKVLRPRQRAEAAIRHF